MARRERCRAPSWFDKLTMRASLEAAALPDLILSLSKDEVGAADGEAVG
jgi:hypothetical protein